MVKFDNNNNNYNLRNYLDYGGILSVLFVGVGGQGIILATKILAHAAIFEGYDVKVSEVHGMAQRGGSVEGSVRFGKKVFSPTINKADFLIGLEKLEALRYINKLKNDGFMIVSDFEIYPSSLNTNKNSLYPKDINFKIKSYTDNVVFVDAVKIAKELNDLRVVNTVLLGVLSCFLPIKLENWQKAILQNISSKVLSLNIKAFEEGKKFLGQEGKCL